MQKICLIERYDHVEVVWALAKLIQHLNIDLVIVANQDLLDQIVTLKSKKIPIQSFNPNDFSGFHMLLTTINPNDLGFIKKINTFKTSAIIHNSNLFFSKPQKNKYLCLLKRYLLKTILFRNIHGTKVIDELSSYYFPAMWMNDNSKHSDKLKGAIPISFCNKLNISPEKDYITIGIPGTFSPKSKDLNLLYLSILDLNPKKQIQIHFLGNCSSAKSVAWVKKFKSLNLANITFKFENSFVSTSQYYSKLQHIDFLIAPIKKDAVFVECHEEYYGKSKISGTQSDMILNATPTIWPSFYPLSTSLEGITTRYNSHVDLSKKIRNWIENCPKNNLKQQRQAVYEDYKIERQAVILSQLL